MKNANRGVMLLAELIRAEFRLLIGKEGDFYSGVDPAPKYVPLER